MYLPKKTEILLKTLQYNNISATFHKYISYENHLYQQKETLSNFTH